MTSLKDWLRANDLTDLEFAERMGISAAAVSRYRRGLRYPGPKALLSIKAETAGAVTADDLLATWRAANPDKKRSAAR